MDLNLEEIEKEYISPYMDRFKEFFTKYYGNEIDKIKQQGADEKSFFSVDFAVLSQFDPVLADELLDNPEQVIEASHDALKDLMLPAIEVKFANLPKTEIRKIENLRASDIGRFICIIGHSQNIKSVQQRLHLAVWQCHRCGNVYKIPQAKKKSVKPPFSCECKNKKLEINEERSSFTDFQEFRICQPLKQKQKKPYINAEASGNLVNSFSINAPNKFNGILRINPMKRNQLNPERYLEVNSIEQVKVAEDSSEEELEEIYSGEFNTKLQERRKVLGTMLELLNEEINSGLDMVPIDTLISKGKEKGINEDKIKWALEELVNKGEAYMPKRNFFKSVSAWIKSN